MVRHIVLFRLEAEDAEQRRRDVAGIKERLERLTAVIPGVLSLVVHGGLGLVPAHWDCALVADYSSSADLEAYQAHPAHVEAGTWINTVVLDRAVVDFVVA